MVLSRIKQRQLLAFLCRELTSFHSLQPVSYTHLIRVIADDGTINENGGKYNGMDRYECRKAIVKDLEEQGYLCLLYTSRCV